jgi:hypothetical protein
MGTGEHVQHPMSLVICKLRLQWNVTRQLSEWLKEKNSDITKFLPGCGKTDYTCIAEKK